MRLRGTNPAAVRAATRRVAKAGLSVSEFSIEAHLLSGGDINAVLDAMTTARDRGLPENFPAIAEAQLAGVDLDQFVRGNYRVDGFRTSTELRAAAVDDPEAALTLATQLLATLDEFVAMRARGPENWLDRLVWKQRDESLARHQAGLRAQILELVDRFPGAAGTALRDRLHRAV